MNDIWVLPSGEWIVYSDDEQVIKDFKSLAGLQVIASYHGVIKRRRAVQFRFAYNEDLLRYICYKAGFDYSQVIKLSKRPGDSYNLVYSGRSHQPNLLVDVDPPRKKKRRSVKGK